MCWNKGRDASDGFYRHISGGHSFPLLWLPQNSSFFQAKLCVCVFFFSGLIGELFGRKDSSGKHDFTCDRFISSPGIRPVALTSRGTEDRNRDFLEFFWKWWGCCHWTGVLFWWWPLFLGWTSLLKGDAQEGAVKVQISPVSLLTGGWTVSMGCVIVMRGV